MVATLITMLTNSLNNYNDTDPKWRQFIDDHKAYLIANSQIQTISSSFMQGYTYALERYLRSISYKTSCTWIILLINNLVNNLAFTNNIGSLLIPPFQLIEDLYTTYLTAQQTGT